MDYETFNEKAKKIFDDHMKEISEIESKAKAEGTWCYWGLESNNHLFKELYRKAMEKINELILT